MSCDHVEEFVEKVGTASISSNNTYQTTYPVAGEHSCWAELSQTTFTPSPTTTKKLPGGMYTAGFDSHGKLIISVVPLLTDTVVEVEDIATVKMLDGIRKFWTVRDRYKKSGLLHKRGVLLWGPTGSGKTIGILILVKELIREGGLAFLTEAPKVATIALQKIREVEPDRPMINVIEDIDTLIERYNESDFLSLLDGENQVENIVHLATTNYPEYLRERMIDRPSRFDEIIKVPMPSDKAKLSYLSALLPGNQDYDLERWVRDSEGFSMAHLRELMVRIYCLGQDYESAIFHLRSMHKKLGAGAGFKVKPNGGAEPPKTVKHLV